jgi:membrane protein DedA with SNARE-associated domain
VPPLASAASTFTEAIARTGSWAPLILFAASLIEHVFPPFPGDLIVVLGAWYAHAGELSWAATFLAVTSGATLGAWVDYRIGASLGRRLDRHAARKGTLSAERLARFEASYRRYGAWLLLGNRFLPGVRAFLFLAAGASGIPLAKVLVLGGVSAALWNAALLGAGALLASNAEELVALVERYDQLALLAVGASAVVLVAVLWRRRATQRAAPEGR